MNVMQNFLKSTSKQKTLTQATGHPKHRSGCEGMAILTLLILAAAAPLAMGQTGRPAPAHNKVQAELLSVGSMRYKLGTSGWLTQDRGAMMVLLPVTLQTDKSPCRLIVPNLGTFQADAGSQFTISLDNDDRFTMSVEKGSVFYSLGSGMTMRVNSPVPGMGATVSSLNRGGPIGMFSTNTARYGPTSGVPKQAQGSGGIHFFNVNGETRVENDGQPARQVNAGRALHVMNVRPAATGPRAAARNTQASAPVFLEMAIPPQLANPGPRPGSTDNLSGPNLQSGGGGIGYYDRDDDSGRDTEIHVYEQYTT